MKKLLVFVSMFYFTVAYAQPGTQRLKVSSLSFEPNGAMPAKYTCEGDDINPALNISGIPAAAKELALVVSDPDASGGTFTHWIVYNIPLAETIEENSVPGKQGRNDFGRFDYGGPCPPRGTHRYIFTVYALDAVIVFPDGVHKDELETAMSGHVIAKDELVGYYQRKVQ